MSDLLDLQRQLQDTSAAISELERALAAAPESFALEVNLASIEKRFAILQEEFNEAASRYALDVCSYRLFRGEDTQPSLRGFSGALREFQTAFSALYDALRNGRRERVSLSPEVIAATSFVFAYAFSGSVGVVLTLEHQRMLFRGDEIDNTFTTFFNLAQAPTREDIKAIGRTLGPAPLRAVYKWAQAHLIDGLGADITWRHETEDVRLFMQPQELERLRAELAATGDETVETVEATGELLLAGVRPGRFHFMPDTGDEVRGITDAIEGTHPVTVPARYRVKLEKRTTIQYSSEHDIVTWRLLAYQSI